MWKPSSAGGRPTVGPKVETRLPTYTLQKVDAFAAKHDLTRAEALRQLISDALPHAPGPSSEDMEEALRNAQRQSLQKDLRTLVARLRDQAPSRSAEYTAGIEWAALYLENTANQLTEQ